MGDIQLTHLVLFDIDGTLLWPDRAGRVSMQAALERVYGTAGPVDGFRFNGRTDSYIIQVLMNKAGIPDEIIRDRFDTVRRTMIEELSTRLAACQHDVQPCPGTHELIAALEARGDVLLGLLTGNFEETAELKIRAAHFDPALFQIGAFGGESPDRDDLPPLAVERARLLTGVQFIGKQIAIIGDTAHDIACGRVVGARTIAVLTGWEDRSEIEEAEPDFLFEDLSDTQQVIEAIFRE